VRLGSGLFLVYLLIFALCFSWPISHIAGDLRTRYLEGVEEPLVDQANILAGIIGHEMESGGFSAEALSSVFDEVYARDLSAAIYEMRKRRVDARIYITDAVGTVLFDSLYPANVGEDYSDYRDVSLTLKGEYGARTTRDDRGDPSSAVLYVAAPIRARGETAGVLTVAEPTSSVNAFLRAAKPRIIRIGVLSALVAVSLSLFVSLWLSGQIGRLTRYARDVSEGRRVGLPRLAPTELRQMGESFDRMRETLEGKKYVEQYVQTLTHEIKSPVSAIQGAAELLEEEMSPETRARFLGNIRAEAGRIEDLVERMLKLSELEMRQTLQSTERIPFAALVRTVLESKQPMLSGKRLDLQARIEEDIVMTGDPFLLHQAIANLLQNAIDFSPEGGRLGLDVLVEGDDVLFTVQDEGPGIPAYATGKVFDKFYSLRRPDTGKKSTGLGLTLVREVASLHHGEIRLENLPEAGLRATLRLPALAGRTGCHPAGRVTSPPCLPSDGAAWPGPARPG